MRSIILFIMFLSFGFNCSDKKSKEKDKRDQILHECMKGFNSLQIDYEFKKSYCECAVDQLSEKELSELSSYDNAYKLGLEAGIECIKYLDVKSLIIQGCLSHPVKEQFPEKDYLSYCECAAEYIEDNLNFNDEAYIDFILTQKYNPTISDLLSNASEKCLFHLK